MATAVYVPIAEYLNTTYRPDCDYVDGEVRERNWGDFAHSSTQAEVGVWQHGKFPQGARRVLPEQRVQVKATRYRIPDVCVLADDAPREAIIRTPPILCVEILSKDDRMSDILVRVKEYFEMGVPVCWIIDPLVKAGWVATPGNLADATDGILRAGDLEMPLDEVLG